MNIPLILILEYDDIYFDSRIFKKSQNRKSNL